MRSSETPESVTTSSALVAQSRCSPLLTPLVYFLGQRIVLPLYFGPIRITGQHHIPRTGPVILAPTHRARWDSILVPLAAGRPATGRDLRFMVTADEVKGIQGWFIRRLGGFPVNVRRPTVASLRYGIDLLSQGEMLVIYPEGGIFRDRQVHRLKPGLARLAVQAEAAHPDLNVQILPINIDYYGDAYPRWRCPVQITIAEPLAVKDYLHGQDAPEVLKAGAKQLTADLQASLEGLMAQLTAVMPPQSPRLSNSF